jgi:regulator of protease activity HflC (stomatin/prohibitin superfamily)
MGPNPEIVPPDSLTTLVARTLSGQIGTRLSTTALDAMIAQGHVASIESAELRQDLANWLSLAVDQRNQQRENTRAEIREAQAYARTILPYALIAARNNGLMGIPHDSRFPLDVAQVLSDATLEGAIAQLATWRGSICGSDAQRGEQVQRLISGIDAELLR